MSGIFTYTKNLGLAAALACGMVAFTGTARAQNNSQDSLRNAQQQLKTDGYYKGAVDGVDGPMTRAAIRKYQADKNLTVTGKLDRQTRDSLGLSATNGMKTTPGEANRSAAGQNAANQNDANRNQDAGAVVSPSSAAVSAAQRSLQKKGFYKGNIDGTMSQETVAAIREYQKNSNLNVTGKLDDATLSSLGVSK